MSDVPMSEALARQDLGEVTVLRVQLPMLRADETTEALFRQVYAVVEAAGRTRLVLSLDGVVYLASGAIGHLAMLLRKVRSAGGKLALCKLTRSVDELLQVTHLTDILPVGGDEREAVALVS
jgi:anti-anti-sigma factor